jgi:hypothetical protein
MKIPRLLPSKLAVACVVSLSALSSGVFAGTITNATSAGTVWRDPSNGTEIINNCGNVLQVGSTFYWYGWDKYNHTVNVYTSTTLASNSWVEHTGTGFPMFGSGFHGRPDVVRRADGTYLMVVEFSSPQGRNGIQYLTSPSPTGPFTSVLQEHFVMDGSGNLTITMGDKGLFQDDDANKTIYLLCTSDDGGNTNGTHKIIRLNSNGVGQNAVIKTWTVSTNRREALAIFKRNGTFYMTSSGTHGWNSGATWYKTAATIGGTWTAWTNVPTNPNSTNSYNTQHDYILKIVGSSATSFVYIGDRWSQDTGIGFGRSAWYPLTFDASGVPTIKGDTTWSINPTTGVIGGTPTTITVSPAKDAMVKFAAQTTNFGTQNQLQVSNQTNFQKQIFIQFNITSAQVPTGATVTGATLLIASQSNSSGTVNAHAVSNTTWIESGTNSITWSNKPALGATLGTGDSSHTANVDSTWNVTSHVTGNGNFTIGLDTTNSGDINFHSREATDTNNRPLLQITYQP